MKRYTTLAALILLILAAATTGSAAAEAQEDKGEPQYRCSYELHVCLDWMAKHYSTRGCAGMQLDTSDGVYTVTEIHAGSPAAKAKVRGYRE